MLFRSRAHDLYMTLCDNHAAIGKLMSDLGDDATTTEWNVLYAAMRNVSVAADIIDPLTGGQAKRSVFPTDEEASWLAQREGESGK